MKNPISPFRLKLTFTYLRDVFTNRFILFFAALICTSAGNAADLVWIGGTGNWNAAGNWSPAQIPTSADNAIITNNGIYTVTVPANSPATANSITVGGASGAQILAIDKTTLTIAGASIINANGQMNFLVAGSTLTGAGDLMVNGAVNWANGTTSGAGTLTIGTGGTLAIGSSGVTFGRTLNNNGSGTWAGGNLTMSAGVAFNNLASGRFDITADGRLMGGATTPVNNSGLFRQTAGSAGTVVSVPFNNSGTLDVLVATLNLNLGGNHTGTMSNALGATLSFGGGNHVLASSSFVTGAGVLSVSGGATTLSASGTFDVTGSTLSINTGTATLTSSCNVTGTTLNIGGTGGVVLYNSAGTVSAVNLTAGTLGTLGGINPVIITGPLTLGGGKITNALITANGGITINGNVTLSSAKLVNPGTATWTAGNITGANGAVISNLFGATFNNTFDGIIAAGAGVTPVFVNAGLFQKTGGTAAAGATSIDFQFINTGTVEVQTNTLRYGFNQQTAGLTLLDGGGLSAQAQPIQLLGGSLIGTNLITVANTQNIVNSATISPGLPLGELDIAGNYQQTASGVLNIDLGGYLAGTNFDLVTVAAGGAGGVATLGGTLNVSLTNGFLPTNGATFTFLTAASRVGAFATFNYPSNDIGMQLSLNATSATIKVTNLKPVVTNPIVDPAAITYGGAFNFQFPANAFTDPDNDTLTYTASGMPFGVSFLGSTRTFSGTPTQAGSFPVTVVATDNGTPSLSVTNTFNITVTPATLAISAQPQAKLYGAADPALTYLVSGLQLSDTLATVLTGALTRGAGETVAGGPYAITQGTLLANSNYTLSFTGSTLTISPATLTVTAQPQGKIYGASDPMLTFSVSGLQFSDTQATVLTGALGRASGESAAGNPYAILQGTLAANGNYTISFTGNTFLIAKAALSVTADPKTKTYGAADPSFTVSYSGFVNGETSTLLSGTLSFTRAPGENVGSYLVTPSGLTSANYAIAFNTGSLSITKAALSVTADPQTKVYGAADPTFTATDSGFANGDTAAALGGTLSFTRAPGENVSSYLITPSGLSSPNYTITFNTANLSITKAALSITANAQTKTYGASDPSFTVGYVGLVNGDTSVALSGTLSFTRAPGENAGSYPITPSGLTSGNYTITFNPGALTIGKAALSITADAKSKVYGNADTAFTVTYAGFVNGDSAATLGGILSFVRAPGENIGGYLITPSGLTSVNYSIAFNTGALAITSPAPALLPLSLVGTNVLVSWSSLSNGIYRVQYISDLSTTNWTDLPGDVIATGNTASKTDAKTTTNRFYRVRVLP